MRASAQRVGVLCAVLLTCLASTGCGAAAQTIDLSRLVVEPNPRIGLSFPGSQVRYYPYMAGAGVGVARIAVTWQLIEPERGRYNWRGLDERVGALLALGIRPFLTFESKSDWGTRPETSKVKNGDPTDLGLWTGFVGRVTERYDGDGRDDMPGLKGRVVHYQAANEWESPTNPSGGWIGSGAALIAYINATHDAVKAADPQAVFVLGGIASFNLDVLLVALDRADFRVQQRWSEASTTVFDRDRIKSPDIAALIDERVMPVLREARYDIADAHLYGPEERDAARLALLAELSGRPVLSAECGGPSRDYGDDYTPEGHFLAAVHRHLNVLASGGAFCLWFRLGEDDKTTWGNRFTALYTNDARPKPGVWAFRMLARLLGPDVLPHPLPSGGFELRGSGDPVRLAWGEGAADVLDWAARGSTPAWCLIDPVQGTLAPVGADCAPGAFIVAGSDVARLLSLDP
ncbi:hypothetical protein LAZ40_22205 [Cereibacter sphaeroides]|uniref:hypothetical protein n=1 Tax=Cereibacter sphaeroides TaxID=1063 RepID=UPI001F2D4A15|nr:hypothetical protein [Cereibacter sphaeroides]MCE6953149.1 hypothetical protein [Cereibacter sphaeroides]MCE6961751.1 hypothetical protein [Cereibacter sphaeroides]MCE6975101.1 hypothetical protein [Cereibacter sphaeroides]